MRLLAPLGPARTLATATILRRGAFLGALALAERLLTAATAWALFAKTFEVKVEVSFALGTILAVRSVARQALSSRTEADVLNRAIASVLDGDILNASVLPAEDAKAELGQGVYFAAQQLTGVLPALAADLVAGVLLAIVVALVEPPRLIVPAAALASVAALAFLSTYGRLHQAMRAAWALRERVIDKMVDALEGRLEIVASGERATFLAGAHERTRAWALASTRAAVASVTSGRVPLLVIASLAAVSVVLDSRWVQGLSTKIADVAFLASVTPTFAGVAQGIVALVQTEPMTRTVSQVIEGARPARAGKAAPGPLTPFAFDAVSFRYENASADALTKITWALQHERIIALSGTNGSGKSTCLRLLLALGRPKVGAVRVGGADLAEVDADAWRKGIAFLPQRPYLPMRSNVRAAIRLLAPGASDARIESALRRVGVLESLRRAADDPLAASVDALSVGQRQRVALARLLCRDAALFVLDEPDANLDQAGVELVVAIVRELAASGRVVLAAHTPELIAVANRVVVLEGGRIVPA
jgi:ATP-binding cassette subfamily C protein CydCD